jgi:hypothetical protein
MLLLFFHLRPSTRNGIFLLGNPTTSLLTFVVPSVRATGLASFTALDFITLIIIGETYPIDYMLHPLVIVSPSDPIIIPNTMFSDGFHARFSLSMTDDVPNTQTQEVRIQFIV